MMPGSHSDFSLQKEKLSLFLSLLFPFSSITRMSPSWETDQVCGWLLKGNFKLKAYDEIYK